MVQYIQTTFIKHNLLLTLLLICTSATTTLSHDKFDFSDVESPEALTARLKEIVIACAQSCKMPGMDKTSACTSFCVEKELDTIIAKALIDYMKNCQGNTPCMYQKIKETLRRANIDLNYMVDEAVWGRLK